MLAPTGLGATECIAVGEGLAPPLWWDQHRLKYAQKPKAGFGRGKPLPYGLQLNQLSVLSVGGRTQFTPLRGACCFTEAPREGESLAGYAPFYGCIPRRFSGFMRQAGFGGIILRQRA